MADRPYDLLQYELKADFSGLSIALMTRKIENFQKSIPEIIDNVGGILARMGVAEAKQNISDFDAVDTGELRSSIRMEHNSKSPSVWTVFTDCEHARFVEFGTGIVGANSPHYSGTGLYFRTTPWTYYTGEVSTLDSNGETVTQKLFATTRGMASRPFMYMTAEHLNNQETIDDAVEEAFKK